MNIVVIRGNGFVGTRLVRKVAEHGHEPVTDVRTVRTDLECEVSSR